MIKSLLKKYPRYKWFIAVTDMVVFLLSYIISFNLTIFKMKPAPEVNLFPIYSLFVIIVLFAMQYNGLYKRRVLFTYINHAVQLFRAFSYSSIILILFLYFVRPFGLFIESRMAFIGLNAIPFVILWIVRTQVIIRMFRSSLLGNMVRENVLIFGAGEKGKMIAASLDDNRGINTNILGFVDNTVPIGQKIFHDYEVIGSLDDVRVLAQDYPITAIFLFLRCSLF